MTTRTDGLFDREAKVMLDTGEAKGPRHQPRDTQQQPSSLKPFPSSSIPLFSPEAIAAQQLQLATTSHSARRVIDTSVDTSVDTSAGTKQKELPLSSMVLEEFPTNRALDIQVTAEPSCRFLRRIHCVAFAPSKFVKRHLLDSNKITTPEATDEHEDTRDNEKLGDSIQRAISHFILCIPKAKNESDRDSGIEPDRQSALSGDDANEYELMLKTRVHLDGSVEELLATFDTGSPSDFIFRSVLEKIGNPKIHPIPGEIKAYQSPINPNELTAPKYFVRLGLWNDQIGLSVVVVLKILEVPEDPNGFQIILGRKFIRRHGRSSLLARIEQAYLDGPRLATPTNNRFALLRVGWRSKEGKASDKAKDQAREEQDRRTYFKIHEKFQNRLSMSLGSPMLTQSTSTSTRTGAANSSYSAGSQHLGTSTDWPTATIQEVLAPPVGRFNGCPTATQTRTAPDRTAEMPDYVGDFRTRRTDTSSTSSTSSTQYTQFSLSRQSTTSSMSSWGEDDVVSPQKAEECTPGRADGKGTLHHRSNEQEYTPRSGSSGT